MKFLETFKKSIQGEDFYVFTFLFAIFFFGVPGGIYFFVIQDSQSCNLLCGFIKIIFFSMIFFILGVIFNYFLLKLFPAVKKFLFWLIDGKKKDIVIHFVYGSLYSYLSLLFLLLLTLMANSSNLFNQKITELEKE